MYQGSTAHGTTAHPVSIIMFMAITQQIIDFDEIFRISL